MGAAYKTFEDDGRGEEDNLLGDDDDDEEEKDNPRSSNRLRTVSCFTLGICVLWLTMLRISTAASQRLRSQRKRARHVKKHQPRVVRWTAGHGEATHIEEHLVDGTSSGAYAYWRYGLNARAKTRVDATLTVYADSGELLRSALEGKLKAKAIVFLDIAASEEAGIDPWCAYRETPRLFLRSALLRALWSYPLRLTIVISGDVDCRLVKEAETTHNVVFANDASCNNEKWWPSGLGGLLLESTYAAPYSEDLEVRLAGEGDAYSLTQPQPLAERPNLIRAAGLARNLREDLEKIAQEAGLELLTAEDDDWRPAAASSVFGLCDDDDENCALGAMLLGTIPILLNSTTAGCFGPVFWRDGSPAFPHGAPFLFLESTADLPGTLQSMLLEKNSHQEALAEYRALLEDYLRDKLLNPPLKVPLKKCATTELGQARFVRTQMDAARYYKGEWFQDALVKEKEEKNAPLSASLCSAEHALDPSYVDRGALCFDPACAPRTVEDFVCD